MRRTTDIGSTGTRHGMTAEQRAAVAQLIVGLAAGVAFTVHHGDCVGANAELHDPGLLLAQFSQELLGQRRLRSGCRLDLTAQHVAFERENILAQELTKRAVPSRRRDHFEPGGRPEGPEEVDEHVERS